VLLVDDDQQLVEYLVTALRAYGWQVQTAHDANQAYVGSQQERPDVIALDIHMPGGGGQAALRRLRDSYKSFDIPVLLMSTDTDAALSDEMRLLGADGFIQKPLEPDRLHHALLRLAQGKMA
jgi:DNA-binding response OmpR family regulator